MVQPNIFLDYTSESFSTRVHLGLLESSHAPFLSFEMNEPEMRNYLLSNNFPVSMGSEEKWIESLYPNDTNIVLGIFLKESQTLIGVMGLHKISYIHGTSITGSWIGKEWRNKGYGTEAKMLLLKYAFHILNLRKIQSAVMQANTRSAEYSKKCGYVEECRFEKQFFKDGQYVDEIFLAVYRDKWESLWEKFIKN